MMGFILWMGSIIISLFLYPLALATTVIKAFWRVRFKAGLKKLNRQFKDMAVAIDANGNVVCDDMLNVLWVKSWGYKFGNRKETISSVLGKNQLLGTLTWMGQVIAWILDKIEHDHCIKSIDKKV